ncbi:unnamed protein product [Urochloa decumbens]|uniref:C2H2-type domain-containing protein n=1 Tax=Urochloa decumbens TaxID=240449 RepID=A0ABC9CD69_9POAL
MSKGSLFCSLLLLVVCIAQLPPLISSSQLTGGQIGDDDLILCCQDPIGRPPLMSSHGHDELVDDGRSADSIFFFDDDEDAGDEHDGSVDGGAAMAGGGGDAGDDEEEEEDGSLRGDSGGTNSTKGSSGSGDVECPECGKFFRNDKSMFGHLRSHPNRGYKGAIPPGKKIKLSPDTAAASSSCSLFSGTDRTPGQDRIRDPQLSPVEVLCAYVLLTLKHRGSSTTTAQQVPCPPPSSFGELGAIGQAEGGSGGSVAVITRNAVAEIKCDPGGEAGNRMGNCDEHGYPVAKIPKKRRNMPKEVREAHKKKIKFVPPPKEKRPYACKHCKAEFPTNQALGGHVAGHHRDKKAPRLNHPSGMAVESHSGKEQQVEDGGDDDDKEQLSLQRGLLSKVPWQYGNRASGGQMREHYGRKNDGVSPAVAEPTPVPVRADDGDARRPWDIDLNVEAPEQE